MVDSSIQRVVIDTNVFISHLLRNNSIPSRAVMKAEREAQILVSEALLEELVFVLSRSKFDAYISNSERQAALNHFLAISTLIDVPTPIRACRDPRDDKFLEVAVHGSADAILTGDVDLLALHPFHGVAILTPAAYLELV